MVHTADGGRPADCGSITVFAVIFTMAVIFLALMLADLGNRMNAEERAADTAEQAARAAADTLNPAALRSGQVVIDGPAACNAASALVAQYKTLSGIDAILTSCTAGDPIPRQATVTVMVTTTSIFAAILPGGYTVQVTESACAEFGITTGAAC